MNLRCRIGVYTGNMNANDPIAEIKDQATDVLQAAGDQLSEHASQLQDLAHDARYRAEDFIQTNPWLAIGIAASIGFAFGASAALIRR